jgi:hypothetical protein
MLLFVLFLLLFYLVYRDCCKCNLKLVLTSCLGRFKNGPDPSRIDAQCFQVKGGVDTTLLVPHPTRWYSSVVPNCVVQEDNPNPSCNTNAGGDGIMSIRRPPV